MNKKKSITILIGFAIGVFIIQPLGISIFNFGNQANEINWWHYLKNNLIEILNTNGNQIFENILFGLLGVSIALIYYFGIKNRKH
ncbi:hypothetical protein [uncultured Winogradskyella sp.]|uniref:hypothetical protein n=1 Tax=Flavobacteriaceae TaxID=49546 RepID=UPI0030D97DD0|tara:strand:+ start:417 stop:671 length:255 start_codon:yes stop_codon:yes gene_type:complete